MIFLEKSPVYFTGEIPGHIFEQFLEGTPEGHLGRTSGKISDEIPRGTVKQIR